MKYSLCIEPIFEEVPLYDRFRIAKDMGLDAVEFWAPWNYVKGITPAGLGKASAQAGIPVAACCLNDSWACRMTAPWKAVKQNLELSFAYAREMGVSTLIGLSGDVKCKLDTEKVLLVENLKRAGELAEKNGITVVIEVLNSTYNHKGYYLDSSYVGFEIMKAVENPNIRLLYDCYHMQLMEGNLINNILGNLEYIGHIHAAGVPGRHELHKGEINYPFLIRAAEEAGYDKYFGLEYIPSYDSRQSLADTLKYIGK